MGNGAWLAYGLNDVGPYKSVDEYDHVVWEYNPAGPFWALVVNGILKVKWYHASTNLGTGSIQFGKWGWPNHHLIGYMDDLRITNQPRYFTDTAAEQGDTLFSDPLTSYDIGPYVAPVAASSGVNTVDSYWTGYMDEFRLTNGTGRYASNFTVPSQEFGNQKPVIIGDQHYNSVSLSAHMNGENDGTSFTDSSSNSHTITAVGDAKTKRYEAGTVATTTTATVEDPNLSLIHI